MFHATLLTLTISAAVAIFLGAAVYVISRNPHLLISWVFAGLSLLIAGIYLSSIFMVSGPDSAPDVAAYALRLKWAAIILGPALFLHLASFYFPPRWQNYQRFTLMVGYLLSFTLAWLTLFTDYVIAGPRYETAPHIIRPLPGRLMSVSAAIFMVQLLVSAGGLLACYLKTYSSLLRRQVFVLFVSTGLVMLASLIHWVDILIAHSPLIPHELTDILLLAAAFLSTGAVIRYGSFVGRPVARRSLFYSALIIGAGLLLLYFSLAVDRQVMRYTPFPYPPVTGILLMAIVVGYPAIQRWLTGKIDRWFFQAEQRQQELAYHLVKVLAQTPDPEQMQHQLLDALCAILNVRKGFVALAQPEAPPDMLTVQVVFGDLAVRVGDAIKRPVFSWPNTQPHLADAISGLMLETGWQEISLILPLAIDENINGVLALGQKHNALPFTWKEMTLCSQLAGQLGTVGQMRYLSQQRNRYLELARSQSQALQQLSTQVINSARHTFTTWEQSTAPIEIRILGPMQLYRHGQLVPEANWGSEKAKLLLAYLLWKSPAGVTREELSEVLWPNRPFEDTANVFHVTLHRLRRVFQPVSKREIATNYILHDRGRYRFNTDSPYWLDATAFETLVRQDNLEVNRAAVNLYRGQYLEDLAWALPPEIEFLQRQFERKYLDLLHRLVTRVDQREAVIFLEKILAIEPTNETALQALVLSYLAQGRRDLARRQVHFWQQAMIELDLDPTITIATLAELVDS